MIEVECVEIGEPPPPPEPVSGTKIIERGDHSFLIDWTWAGAELQIDDLDMVISLDDEVG